MFKIRKEFTFSASHQLRGLPETHPCSRLHGHNYIVTVELKSTHVSDIGFVRDYHELDEIKKYIDTKWDHRHLNDQMLDNPTAENMAQHLFMTFKSQFPELCAIEVSETPKTNAIYYEF
jgi:6-pyruvoyltetrahydropterin/6-carboxytetrahydropterin synthase